MPQLPPEAYGLLRAIAGPESGGKYNVIYGGRTVDDLSRHPNIAVPITSGPNAGSTSTAAGKYQFLKSTWDDIAGQNGIRDFSPASQDQGAWALANRDYTMRTGQDLTAALQAGKIQDVAKALSPTWTSLAGGIEAQPGGTGQALAANYAAGAGQPQGLLAAAQGEPATINAAGATAPTPEGAQGLLGAAQGDTAADPMKAIQGLLGQAQKPAAAQPQQPEASMFPDAPPRQQLIPIKSSLSNRKRMLA